MNSMNKPLNVSFKNYKICKLEEIVTFKRGKNLTSSEMIIGKYPVVSAGIDYSGYHNDFNVKGPSITISSSGANAGIVLFHNYNFWAADCLYAYKSNDYIFSYYFLKNLQPVIFNLQRGSAQPHVYSKNVNNLVVVAPSTKEQKKIGDILYQYDKLIENNNKRIKLLDNIAETLYNEWFVHFRFPGIENDTFINGIPRGWKILNLFDVANIVYGFPFNSDKFSGEISLNPVVRIRDILSNDTNTYTDEECGGKYNIEKNSILIGMDGFFHMNLWSGKKAYLNQRVVKLNSKIQYYSNFMLYYALYPQIKELEKTIVGTTVAHLGDKHLKRIKIIIPEEDTLKIAYEYFEKLLNLRSNLLTQNFNLVKQRDALLPRLMSGKLSVEGKEIL